MDNITGKDSPILSIIVPVYNAEKTLKRCVDSVLGQEFENFELILVDDGSGDGSGSVCDGYAAKDSRVRVIHKANTGVSDSRNTGISAAKGKYLQFVDSDDWITRDASGKFVETAEKYGCDLVVSDFYRVIDNRMSQKGNIPERGVFSLGDYAAYMMKSPADFYYGVLWNKLYRRDIIERDKIRMNPEIRWCEDFLFNLEYIRRAKVFYSLHSPLYYYVRTSGSLSTPPFSMSNMAKIKRTVFECYNDFYKSVLSEEEYEKMRFKVYRFLVDSADDGRVPKLPRKSGRKKSRIYRETLPSGDALTGFYLRGKLIDALLEPIAYRYDLTPRDVRLLLCLESSSQPCERAELADRMYTTPQAVSHSLQHLASRDLIVFREVQSEKETDGNKKSKVLQVTFLDEAKPVMEDIAESKREFYGICTADFTPEEKELYKKFEEKINLSVEKALADKDDEIYLL